LNELALLKVFFSVAKLNKTIIAHGVTFRIIICKPVKEYSQKMVEQVFFEEIPGQEPVDYRYLY